MEYKKLWLKNWLKRQYLTKGRSISSLAVELGCSWGAVKYALVQLKIKRRKYTLSKEAMKARRKGAHALKPKQGSIPKRSKA